MLPWTQRRRLPALGLHGGDLNVLVMGIQAVAARAIKIEGGFLQVVTR